MGVEKNWKKGRPFLSELIEVAPVVNVQRPHDLAHHLWEASTTRFFLCTGTDTRNLCNIFFLYNQK